MKSFKKLALVAAMSSFAFAASAMSPIQDADLSQISGQDGVSIAANLQLSIGEFKYTDTDATGGSVSFKGIQARGSIAATIDIINNATALNADPAAGPIGEAFTVLGLTGGVDALPASMGGFLPVGDVVIIAVPRLVADNAHKLNVSVDSIKMGNSTASFGSVALNDIQLQGTTVYIWAH
jgi:hypothetical protein